jgi:hypothetical protein
MREHAAQKAAAREDRNIKNIVDEELTRFEQKNAGKNKPQAETAEPRKLKFWQKLPFAASIAYILGGTCNTADTTRDYTAEILRPETVIEETVKTEPLPMWYDDPNNEYESEIDYEHLSDDELLAINPEFIHSDRFLERELASAGLNAAAPELKPAVKAELSEKLAEESIRESGEKLTKSTVKKSGLQQKRADAWKEAYSSIIDETIEETEGLDLVERGNKLRNVAVDRLDKDFDEKADNLTPGFDQETASDIRADVKGKANQNNIIWKAQYVDTYQKEIDRIASGAGPTDVKKVQMTEAYGELFKALEDNANRVLTGGQGINFTLADENEIKDHVAKYIDKTEKMLDQGLILPFETVAEPEFEDVTDKLPTLAEQVEKFEQEQKGGHVDQFEKPEHQKAKTHAPEVTTSPALKSFVQKTADLEPTFEVDMKAITESHDAHFHGMKMKNDAAMKTHADPCPCREK